MMLVATISAAAAHTGGTCHITYAPQHSYTSLNLTAERVHTREVWYVNGDVVGSGPGATVESFCAMNETEVSAALVRYFTNSTGKNIDGGFNSTNAIILDVETPVNLKLLGQFLETDPDAFDAIVKAYILRAHATRALFPNAQLGFCAPARLELATSCSRAPSVLTRL
jgi:hypothetical protein